MSDDLVPVTTGGGELVLARRPADRNPALVYLARLAPGSRRTMAQALETMASILTEGRVDAETLPWGQLEYQHAAALRAALAERYSPASVNKMLSALRGVFKEAWRLGLMTAEDLARVSDLPPVRGETLPRGRALSTGELRALFSTCRGGTPADARDAALMGILYGGGLRRSEAVALDVADYNPESGELRIRAGKGMKDRLSYATNGGSAALEAWLAVRGDAPGPLLCPVDKAGRVTLRRMTAQAVLLILRRRAERAGVQRFSPHDLRRTFVSDLLDSGADVVAVQKLAGHANVATTARYDRRGEQAKRKASQMLHVPYAPPRGTPT